MLPSQELGRTCSSWWQLQKSAGQIRTSASRSPRPLVLGQLRGLVAPGLGILPAAVFHECCYQRAHSIL